MESIKLEPTHFRRHWIGVLETDHATHFVFFSRCGDRPFGGFAHGLSPVLRCGGLRSIAEASDAVAEGRIPRGYHSATLWITDLLVLLLGANSCSAASGIPQAGQSFLADVGMTDHPFTFRSW